MTTFIRTKNTTYEMDADNKRIRLMESKNPPHHKFLPAGEWKTYYMAQPLGGRLYIQWDEQDARYTSTSSILSLG